MNEHKKNNKTWLKNCDLISKEIGHFQLGVTIVFDQFPND